jgi:hypothetical protein
MMRKLLVPGLAVLSAITFSPLAHAEVGDQSDAEQAVRAIYSQKHCGSPPMPMHLQSISWSTFYPASGGEGRIVDTNPALGGPFRVNYFNPRIGPAVDGAAGRAYGQWEVDLQFC